MSDLLPRKDRTASLMLERTYQEQGYQYLFGIDEAGRGPMAGPLVAAAVCLPLDNFDTLRETLKGVKDSKQMTHRQRVKAADMIREVAITWGIGEVSATEISEINQMTEVTLLAMRRAVEDAVRREEIMPQVLLVDYYRLPWIEEIPQESLKQGETHSLSIAAASVLAKTYRDAMMVKYAVDYPKYGFEKHKGYPTAAHQAALRQYGVTDIHRRNYAPVKRILAGE